MAAALFNVILEITAILLALFLYDWKLGLIIWLTLWASSTSKFYDRWKDGLKE